MRWLNSKASGRHRFFLLKQILLSSVILCFLIVFNLSFADELTDPSDPNWEHPWDDLCETGTNRIPQDLSEADGEDDVLILKLGFGSGIIIYLHSAERDEVFGNRKTFGASQKNRGHLLIFIK